jgi:phosphonate transport system ATP-binding protein
MDSQDPHQPKLRVHRVSKRFGGSAYALRDVSLSVAKGEMVGLLGASGSGKSTLIRTIAGLVRIDQGEGRIDLDGQAIQAAGDYAPAIRAIRRRTGVVFQQFNLVGQLSVISNVLVAAAPRVSLWRALTGHFPRAERLLALEALSAVGLQSQAWQRASTLSGGQAQRAALARTLVQGAELLLADEPVASLDPESARKVMEQIRMLNQTGGMTVVVSLHQVQIARRYCPRIIALKHGELVYDGPTAGLDDAGLRELYGSEAEDLFEEVVTPANPRILRATEHVSSPMPIAIALSPTP